MTATLDKPTDAPGNAAQADICLDRSTPDWYKDAIIYQLHVKAFFDANGDGVGDFAGLMQRLDYVQELGVSTIWLLPFYPSPLRDDGYDIADYVSVNPSYGDLDQFKLFVAEAHRRGIRVITELVINHTSDQHPWFQKARAAPPGSPERDFYVWSDTEQRYQGTRIIFLDTEKSNWTWDETAGAYFWHRFYSHQPDLNFANPRVFEEVIKTMRYWLDMGVDGLRLDAVPYLCEREGTNNENLPETHEVLRRIRRELDASYPDRLLLAEANQWPEDTRPYFGDGDECHMSFHFPLMPRMYMALAQEDRFPITDILRQTPEIPDSCQWALFLRNHDELTLEMVTEDERDYLWRTYASDPRARINLGIRRRLAPLLENDRRKIELLNALLLSMPGTPIIYYGDELGMGDNYYLGDRDGVRTPMQWSADRNGGFSRADPQRLYLPPIMDANFGYQAINVEAQQRDSSSLLNWMRRLIAVRKLHPAFGRGTLTFLPPRNRKVLALIREHEGLKILCVFNLSRSAQAAELDLSPYKGAIPVELTGNEPFPSIGELPYMLTLPAYGFYWFALATDGAEPSWRSTPVEPAKELVTMVFAHGWSSVLAGRELAHLEHASLPEFVSRQRWFGGKDSRIAGISLARIGDLPGDGDGFPIVELEATFKDSESQRYFLPLAAAWVMLTLVLSRRDSTQRRRLDWPGLFVVATTAALVSTPVFYAWAARGGPLAGRMNASGLDAAYWSRLLASPSQIVAHLENHVLPAFLVYIAIPEATVYYGGQTPLVLLPFAPFFLFGAAAAVRRFRQPGNLLALLWLLLTALGNSLLIISHASTRYVVAFPAIVLMIALGVEVVWRWLERRLHLPVPVSMAVPPVLAAVLALAQLGYYFGPHLGSFDTEFRRSQVHRDIDDTVYRSLDLPPRTQIHIISRPKFGKGYAGALLDFFRHDMSATGYRSSEELTADLPNLPSNVAHAFFVEPDDIATLRVLQAHFTLEGPFLSPYNIPPESQFVMFFVPAQQ
jgi:trehalose synthase